ncbi:MAG: hypothetical protein MOGMAGMI_00851 [Candidatus Omnitrophica bacterium]|nr:hypothetical protein [Candidatus Omnitrophota bacterium]
MRLTIPELRRICLKADEADKPVYARYVTHTLSIGLIWLFQDLRISANLITALSLALAFAAIPFFAQLTPVSVLIGALLVEAYYVLDAVDGQWARLKKQRSLTGAFFDVVINYVIQPPIFFAIAWGVHSRSGDPVHLLLGFTAAFGSLWILLIWSVRSTMVLTHGGSLKRPETASAVRPHRPSLARESFGWLHKLLVFPWFMYVLTLTSIAVFAAPAFGLGDVSSPVFEVFLSYYGVMAPAVSFILTAYWILTRQLERSLPSA